MGLSLLMHHRGKWWSSAEDTQLANKANPSSSWKVEQVMFLFPETRCFLGYSDKKFCWQCSRGRNEWKEEGKWSVQQHVSFHCIVANFVHPFFYVIFTFTRCFWFECSCTVYFRGHQRNTCLSEQLSYAKFLCWTLGTEVHCSTQSDKMIVWHTL